MLSIVTVAFLDSGLTSTTLHSVLRTATVPYEHIVVDNGPSSVALPQLPYVRYYRYETDCLAAAWNFGVLKARYDRIMVLGMNVLTSKVWDRIAVGSLSSNAIIGQVKRERLTEYIEGWCLGFNKDVWERVGPFDEDFKPCFYEDTEWCARAVGLNIPIRQVDLGMSHTRSQVIGQVMTMEEVVALDKKNSELYEEKLRAFTRS